MNARYVRGAALAGLVALSACSGGEAAEPEASAEAPARVISVELLTVQPEAFTDQVQVVGTVQANRDVLVAAEESGPIREVLVEKGAVVRAGQPIARIDDRLLQAQAEQAASEAALAQETHQRQSRLWEEDRIGSEMAYLRSKYGAQTAEAGARVLRERLSRTVVRAPISGILEDRVVEVGSMVMPGAPVARIVDVASVKINGGIPERFAGQIRPGQAARLVVDALGGREVEGEIRFVGAAVDEASRTFPVEVVVPNPRGDLKPGMIANLRLDRERLEAALVVPQEAVMRVEDGYVVYVAAERDGGLAAEARPVTLGSTRANRVVIVSGLRAGERIVVVGQNQVASGDRLRDVREGGGR